MSRVRFYLSSPLCFSASNLLSPIGFDGLLGAAWAKEKGFFKTPSEDNPENILFPDLPLNIVSPKCYAASSMFAPETATMHPEVFVRTANWQYFFAKQGSKIKNTKYKIDTTWLRAGQEKYWLMVTPYIDFYFECSDWDKLRQYLKIIKDVGFIGAKRAVGYGMINKIKLFIESEDYSILKDGLPTRPLPVKEFNGKVSKSSPIGISSYYAPYWLAYNKVLCYLPPNNQYLPHITQYHLQYMSNVLEENLEIFNERNEYIKSKNQK